jgi:succinoglycan biosynthesis protein ExoV
VKLYWSTLHNFGDSLNPWLWDRLFPGGFDDDATEILVGIGTILNHKIPAGPHKHVFGSGYGYGWTPDVHGPDWTIHCVRGPRTAAKLNLPSELAITDPAVLIRRFVDRPAMSSNEIVFIPHFESVPIGDWATVSRLAGLSMVDPRDTIEAVIEKIKGAKLVVAEAMHGAIVADALRVPWIPVRPLMKKNVNKWLDWFDSLGIVCTPQALPPSSIHEAIQARYSGIREFAKEQLARRDLAARFADKTPINAERTASGAPLPRRSLGDRVRALSDGLVPALDAMVMPPLRAPLARGLRERSAEALHKLAQSESYLSADRAIEDAIQRMEEKLVQLKRHVAARPQGAADRAAGGRH